MSACPKCGAAVGPAARRCIRCGQDLLARPQEKVVCGACGKQVAKKERCLMCGAPLAGAAPAAAAAPAAPPIPAGLTRWLHPPLPAQDGEALLALLDLLFKDDPAQGLWTSRGECLFRMGRFADALAAFTAAAKAEPPSGRTMVGTAAALERLGRVVEAQAPRAAGERLLALDEGEAALKAGKAAEALAAFERAAAGGADQRSDAGRGRALLQLDRPAEALPLIDAVLAKAPSLELWNHRHDCLLRLGRADEALPTLEHLAKTQPGALQPRLQRAACYEALGRHQEAFDLYAAFLGSVPLGAKPFLAFAHEHFEAVKDRLRPPRPAFPKSPAGGLIDQAAELSGRGRLQEAEQTYVRVLSMDPGAVIALLNRGVILAQLGRAAEGLPLLERAVALAPKHPAVPMMHATLLADLGRREEALVALDRAIAIDPFETGAWQNRGAVLNGLERPTEALQSFSEAIRLDPLNFLAWFNRGCSERILGRREAAQASLKRFLELSTLVKAGQIDEQVEQAKAMLAELETGTAPPPPRAVVQLPAEPLAVLGGRYELYRELGRGGFGVVHLAWCRDPEGVVALKSVLPERAGDRARLAEFRREAELWLRLDRHPHIVPVHMVDELDGRLCIAMELVVAEEDGHATLEGWLRHRPPGLVQALRWAIQFCHGMEHAYAKGLRCHRDIKPANILIDHRRQVRISDFGLAVARGEADEAGAAGTPPYMPPEQWRGAACDQRSDIYAFGVTLFQLAARGRLPFAPAPPRDGSPAERRRCFAELRALHEQAPPPALDSPLSAVVARCLAKAPAERYQDFAALRAELEALLLGQAGERVPAPAAAALDAGDLHNKALSLDALGRRDEALACLERAIAADAGYVPAWIAKGTVLDALGRHDQAGLALAHALELAPGDATAWLAKGNLACSAARHEEALRCYAKAIELRPDYGLAWRNRGSALAALGRHDEAAAAFTRGLELDPGSAPGWSNQAAAHNLAGRRAEALASAERALAIVPDLGQAWKAKAEALQFLERTADAEAAWARACAALPDDPDCWGNRGACLSQLRRADEALACMERSLALAPQAAMAWNNKGNLLLNLNRHQEAMACFEKALALDPGHLLALRNRGVCLREMKRPAQALAVLEVARERHPHDTAIAFYMADILMRLNRQAEALPLFVEVGRNERGNRRAAAMAWSRAGDCLLQQGDAAQAVAAWRNALQADPGYEPPRQALAGLGQAPAPAAAAASAPTSLGDVRELLDMARQAMKTGLRDQALNLYEMALIEKPGDPEALNGKGLLIGAQGRHEEALACFDAALAQVPEHIGVTLNKALAEDSLGRGAAAVATYRRFLALLPPADRTRLAKQVAHCEERIRTLGG